LAFIPVPDTVELVIVFQQSGREQRIVINVTNAVAWSIITMETFATSIVEYLAHATFGFMTANSSIEKITLTDLTTASSPSFDWTTGLTGNLPVSGTHVGDNAPLQAALVTTWRTALRGRSFRGRTYMPNLADDDIENDGETVPTARVTQQQTWLSGLNAAIATTTGVNQVIVSRRAGGVPRVTGVATPIVSWDTNNHIDTQRRRIRP
jgi:hypothetical protein